MRVSLVFLAGVLCTVVFVRGQDAAELEVDHQVKSEFVTPHTAWAKPYSKGASRVLFFVNGRGTNAREVVELGQRFDLEAQMVFWGRIQDTPRDDWHGGALGLQRMEQLLAQQWDAFVFLDVAPEAMPVAQQYTMIKAVTEGAGLVLIGTNDGRVLKDKNQLADTPAFLADVNGATAFSVIAGRGVRLPGRPKIEYGPGWEVTYDEWAMRIGKAVLWAAGKEPDAMLTLSASAEPLEVGSLPAAAATLRWERMPGGTVVHIAMRVQDGTVVSNLTRNLTASEGSLALELPRVGAGTVQIDAVAMRDGAVVDFGNLPVAVTSAREVSEIVLDPDWSEVGESLKGRVVLSGTPVPGERLTVSLLDRRDRVVARQQIAMEDPEPAFAFPVEPWFPMLLEVRATLSDSDGDIGSAWTFAHVVKRRRGRFNFTMWDVPRGNLAPVAEESLARTGVTVQLGGPAPPDYVAAYDIAWIPYSTHVYGPQDKAELKQPKLGSMAPACWNDSAAIDDQIEKIVSACEPARRHGVFVYSLGDEIAVRGSCLQPECLDAYRGYLAERYGDIAALNASWGTAFGSFADVTLSAPDDNDEQTSLSSGNFPRWFDRQAFQSHNFCKLCERFGARFRELDPQSRCGFEGAGRFKSADDLDGFVRSNGFWSPYPGTADEVLRSIAPRDFPRSNWMGYTKDADTLLQKYWRMVTRGCDAVWWWRWETLGRFHGWLSPNLDPYPAVKEILADTRIVREGLGDLLLDSEMETDGIGILYSLPSGYAAQVQSSSSFGSYESNHTACHAMVRALGLNFSYFTDRQMRLGEVDLSRFKVIFLPFTQAMGADVAEMFRQYVRNGGTLVADVRPAIYDGHVKPLGSGQLDELFGVRRTTVSESVAATAVIRLPRAQAHEASDISLQSVRVDDGITAAGAEARGQAGETPVWLMNRVGEGTAVLLNLSFASYPNLDAADERVADVSRVLLASAADALPVRLTDSNGARLRHVEVTRWTNGPVQIVSVFRHAGEPEPATLVLQHPMHIYDIKNRQSLGMGRNVPITVTPSRAMFFALSSEPLAPLSLRMAPEAVPGSVQTVRLSSAMPAGSRAVHIGVTQPDGRAADWIDPVALVGSDGATFPVPVALNDPQGRWTVSVTDVYTAQTVSAHFIVKGDE